MSTVGTTFVARCHALIHVGGGARRSYLDASLVNPMTCRSRRRALYCVVSFWFKACEPQCDPFFFLIAQFSHELLLPFRQIAPPFRRH